MSQPRRDSTVSAAHVSDPETPASRNRSNIFDFLRLFAASAVLIQHANSEFGTNFGWGGFELIDGVPLFFIISGMFVYMSAEKIYERTGQWRDFFWNRFLRVAPALWTFAILGPIVFVLVGAVTIGELLHPGLLIWLGSFLVLVPGYDMAAWSDVGAGAVTWPLYTIPAEVSFYIITPILVIAAKRYGFWKTLIPFLVISVIGSTAYFMTGDGGLVHFALNHSFLHQGACFAAGVFWARYWPRLNVRWWWAAIAVVVYFAVKLYATGPIYGALKPIIIAIPLSLAAVWIGYNGPRFLGTLTKRVGDLSFATYIWHYLVINVLLWFGFEGQWWNTGAALVISWAIAAASWWAIEQNALRLKRVSLRA